ncbi:hypothetical protein ZOSMA_7G00760 [Zostera marina]|uniref:Pectin acetylesterase n=1 Tax=Zostera marina TaxID=29655 RepID=A0A0K9NPP0_ZOSMR|nr:hypothetical protein ZOSMA_7G00760 [Zostera marina]
METIVGGEAGKDRAREEEAVCLDGSLPAYHLHRGYGAGANNWVIHLEMRFNFDG